jgi:hypothetical protein
LEEKIWMKKRVSVNGMAKVENGTRKEISGSTQG